MSTLSRRHIIATKFSTFYGACYIIETPPKIWRPKPPSKYQPLDDLNDIDPDLYNITPIPGSKTVFKQKSTTITKERDDIIYFGDGKDTQKELDEK